MKKTKITKTFEIEVEGKELITRFERFLALLHYNGRFGHSALFGMFLDGDGDEKLTVKNLDESLSREVNLIGGVGYDVEIANYSNYSGSFVDRKRESKWHTKPNRGLYKNGELIKG